MIFPYSLGSELSLTSVDWFFVESCDLAAHYTELENKHIQLELDLKLAQENLMKAKEEAKGMLGEAFDDCLCLSLAFPI